MSEANSNVHITLPVVATRGIIVFPGQDVMIEVGRTKSVNAVNEAGQSYDSMVWIVCQNDIMADEATADNRWAPLPRSRLSAARKVSCG